MSKSKARFLAELLNDSGRVKKDKSQLTGGDNTIDLDSLPTITNAKLENSSISIAGHSTALGGSVSLNTGDITEHTDYKYYTDARVRGAISVTGAGSYNSTTGVITITGGVTSVNTQTGAVVLDTDDVSEGSTNLYYTDARVGSYLSTNSYATQSYVGTQIANLVDSAPGTLNTLNELAAALGDDANFSTTVTNSIATKLPSSSYTAADVLTKIKTVDGTGSGLDADLLDGLNSSQFMRSDAQSTTSGSIIIAEDWDSGTYSSAFVIQGSYPSWETRGTSTQDKGWLHHQDSSGNYTLYSIASYTGNSWTQRFTFKHGDGTFRNGGPSGNVYYHQGNDGSGSGLDADTVDGIQASSFLRSDASDSMSGELNVTHNGGVTGSSAPTYSQANIEVQTSSNHVPAIGFHRGGYSATTLYEYDGELYANAWTTRAQTGKLISSGNYSSYALPLSGGTLTGTLTTGGNISVPSNTGFSTSGDWVKMTTSHGYIQLGPANSGHAHIYTDRSNFYFNKTAIYANGNTMWHGANDGAGSGLDADTVDGIQGASFLRSDTSDSIAAGTTYTFGTSNTEGLRFTNSSYNKSLYIGGWSGTNSSGISRIRNSNDNLHLDSGSAGNLYLNHYSGGTVYARQNVVWHAGNDASGSGLDADLLDGQQGSYYAIYDHFRSLGTTAFTGTASTAGLISEMEGDGAFDSYTSAFKTSWSYAGNFNMSDAGRFTETAGTAFLTWTDNSSDSARGNITVLAIAPNTGGSAGKMFVYNDQGSGYGPGWREIWTSTSDGSGSGLDADLLDGYHLNTGRADVANRVVATDGNGYIQAGWINTTSGDLGTTIPDRVYTSNDGYIRYLDLASFRSRMNVTAKTGYQGRESTTTDTNYWVGTMGWGANDLNTVFHYGSGSIDAWSTPNNAPSGTTHWVGSQHLHYSNGSSTAYGHQILVGAGNPSLMFIRGRWGSSFGSWYKMWNASNDGSGSGLDADLLDGLQLHTGRNNEANKVVRTQVNGYIEAGWINTTSGDSGGTTLSRIYASHDGFIRYYTPANFGSQISSHVFPTRTNFENSSNNLSTGTGSGANLNTVFTTAARSGNFDGWSGSNFPPGTSHVQGIQVRHQTTNHYGWQLASQYNQPGKMYLRHVTNGTFYDWHTMWSSHNDGSGSGLDADLLDGQHGSYYAPNANIIHKNANTMTGSSFKLGFHSGSGGTTFSSNHYSMGVDVANGSWNSPNYSDLIIGYHTGIRIGAGYSGIRFYNNSPTTDANNDGNGDSNESLLMTIGGGGTATSGANVTINNQLTVGGIIDANGGHGALNLTHGSILSAATSNWTGNPGGNGKIQYHSNRWYIVGDSSANRIVQFRLNGSDKSYIQTDGTFNGPKVTLSGQFAYTAPNYGHGIFGVYSATRYQHVWSMGTAYKTSADGTSYGNMYGLTYTHTNIGTGSNQAISGLSHQLQHRTNGTLTAAIGSGIWTSGNVTAYSDIAVKRNLVKIPNALEKVRSINGYTYERTDYVKDEEDPNAPDILRQAGVVAQEVEKVLPEVVSGPEGNKAVAYGNIVALLIEAIKEQQNQIEELKEIINGSNL